MFILQAFINVYYCYFKHMCDKMNTKIGYYGHSVASASNFLSYVAEALQIFL